MRFQSALQGLFLFAGLVLQVTCQFTPPYNQSPFQVTGAINGMTAAEAGNPLGGGTITIDGFQIVVPKNLMATLPSITVGWGELFENGEAQLPGTATWQATVYGNRLGNTWIAGLIYIAQMDNRFLQGFIESIDTNGEMIVNGRKMVLNDPIGRFGPNYTDHPLWTVDPESPSVKATTGFPVCIPRSENDPKCPKKNRPLANDGKPIQKLTFKDPATLDETDPDPRLMMPLAPGDFITFSGVDIGDLFLIYALDANLGIYTAPGTKPAYVTFEEGQFAIVQQAPNGEDGETRAVAFTTDRTASIQMYAMDQNPCTGAFTKRNMMRVQVETGAPIGRAVFRGSKTDYSPATRYVGFQLSTGTSEGPEGITAGEFVQPVLEYIVPELTVFGDAQIPIDFTLVPYLAKGSGPFQPGNLLSDELTSPPIVGQLNPWPGVAPPATLSCPPLPTGTPTATATTLATSTTTAGPGPSPDSVFIQPVTTNKVSGGDTSINIDATSNNVNAKLRASVQGRNPAPLTDMISQGNGRWTLQITVKGKADSVTVQSDLGGSSQAVVPQ